MPSLLNNRYLSNPRIIIAAVYVIAVVVAVVLKIMIDLRPHDAAYISKINNFIIYRNSFHHLVNHAGLYGYFPAEQYDEYLYSPTFALLIAPFAALPLHMGVVVWCLFNALAVFFAIRLLPTAENKKTFICWFVLIELLTAIQNVQVNPLVCALFLFTFIAFERRQLALAAFLVTLSVFIKVFGILAAALFILYPGRLRFLAYCVLWGIVLFALPLVAVGPSELLGLYKSWFNTLAADHTKNMEDVSVMRMLAGLSGIPFSEATRFAIQLGAVALFCLQYIRYKAYGLMQFRWFFLASAMIWSIIFNHAAESSTYIIAVTGAAIWFVHDRRTAVNTALIILVFILCSLSPTDIFPRALRQGYIVPLALKALPCFLIWIRLEYDMLTRRDLTNAEPAL